MADMRRQWIPARSAGIPWLLAGSGHAWAFLRAAQGRDRHVVHDPKGDTAAPPGTATTLKADGGAVLGD